MKKARGAWLWLAASTAVVSASAAFVACSSSSNNGSAQGTDASDEGSVADTGTPDSTMSEPDGNGGHPTTDAVADVAADHETSDGSAVDASDGGSCSVFDASGLDEVTDALIRAGLSEEGIRKVMGENEIHLLEAALPR